MHVPCSTWPQMTKQAALQYFGNDFKKGFVVGKVQQVLKKKTPTFTVRFDSLQLTTNKQPLSYIIQYGQNIPDACFLTTNALRDKGKTQLKDESLLSLNN